MKRKAKNTRLHLSFDPGDKPSCSFCSRTEDEVIMAAGPAFVDNAYLCFECLERILKNKAERIIAPSDNRWTNQQRANDLRSIIDQISEISSSNPALLPHIAGFLTGLTDRSRSIEEEQTNENKNS